MNGDYIDMDPRGHLKDRNYPQITSSLYNSPPFYGPLAKKFSQLFHDFVKT